jgi:hypothetical protein
MHRELLGQALGIEPSPEIDGRQFAQELVPDRDDFRITALKHIAQFYSIWVHRTAFERHPLQKAEVHIDMEIIDRPCHLPLGGLPCPENQDIPAVPASW